MIKQELTGTFRMLLRGLPIAFVGKTELDAPNSTGKIRTLHIGPFFVGFSWSKYKTPKPNGEQPERLNDE